jgi:hypothetical protein
LLNTVSFGCGLDRINRYLIAEDLPAAYRLIFLDFPDTF